MPEHTYRRTYIYACPEDQRAAASEALGGIVDDTGDTSRELLLGEPYGKEEIPCGHSAEVARKLAEAADLVHARQALHRAMGGPWIDGWSAAGGPDAGTAPGSPPLPRHSGAGSPRPATQMPAFLPATAVAPQKSARRRHRRSGRAASAVRSRRSR